LISKSQRGAISSHKKGAIMIPDLIITIAPVSLLKNRYRLIYDCIPINLVKIMLLQETTLKISLTALRMIRMMTLIEAYS
jgi:hypothetical protein